MLPVIVRRELPLSDYVPGTRATDSPAIRFKQVAPDTWVYRRRLIPLDGGLTVSTPFMLVGQIVIGPSVASVRGHLPLEGVAWPIFAVGFSSSFAFIDPAGGWLCTGAFLTFFAVLSLVAMRFELTAFERSTQAMLDQLGVRAGA